LRLDALEILATSIRVRCLPTLRRRGRLGREYESVVDLTLVNPIATPFDSRKSVSEHGAIAIQQIAAQLISGD
jgi:hypothetical protein